MSNITVKCGEIQIDGGFVFELPSDLLNQALNPDCEQSWYLQDGFKIADPSDPQRLIHPATAVKSDRLFTSHCVNLKHEIICDSIGSHFKREIMFRDVLNEASLQHSDQLWWVLAVFIIVLLVLMCFLLRKRIFRCFLKREGSENRDPESDEGQI
ncbi:hypothetical protein QQF64_025972 [Cirrhinus molitorella]|uniref:Uncharacterized protein n=1 Tax=Cirrhinus molitorella TaxID=172907 RepID=A0ABR3NQK1_9TELE